VIHPSVNDELMILWSGFIKHEMHRPEAKCLYG
jgi:hypothetical protein